MIMKKFINDPENLTVELLEGLATAYPQKVKVVDPKVVVRATPKSEDKVAVITLGGSGHEPALSGFVGEGLLDASVVGDIFAAPNAIAVSKALEMFNRPAGILLIILNHAGDIMSAKMAMKMAAKKGVNVKSIMVSDDISAGLDAAIEDRRGLAGSVLLAKVVGAAAEEGKSLDEIIEIGEKFNARIATLAVAMTGCTHPQTGGAISELGDDEMEIGMGQHGEAGGSRSKILTAAETAKSMFGNLSASLKLTAGEKIYVMMNGVGATTPMELAVVLKNVKEEAAAIGVEVIGGMIDEILTVQEMAGFQMIIGVVDEVSQKYVYAKSNAPYWTSLGE